MRTIKPVLIVISVLLSAALLLGLSCLAAQRVSASERGAFGLEKPAGENNADYFYYYQGQKYPLTLSTEWIAVRFKATVSLQSQLEIASQEPTLAPFSDAMDIPVLRLTLLKIRPGLGKTDAEGTIASLRANPDVAFANPVFDVGPRTKQALTDEFLVRFKPDLSQTEIDVFNAEHGVQIVERLDWGPHTYLLRTVEGLQQSCLEVANRYFESGKVEYAEPNFLIMSWEMASCSAEAAVLSDDPLFDQQWNLARINAPGAWELLTGSSAMVKIAVIDEGVEREHLDLRNNMVLPGYDASTDQEGDDKAEPEYEWDGHGTAVAGIAAAETDNRKGVAGVSGNLAKIVPIKVGFHVCDPRQDPQCQWTTFPLWLARGIRWAVDHEADVLNNSWSRSGGTPNTEIDDAIHYARTNGRPWPTGDRGAVVVFSTGNENDVIAYPAEHNEVIAVGATNRDDRRWDYSNWGEELDLMAPGIDIITTDLRGSAGYDTSDYFPSFGATSAAAPHVSGLAALILWANPSLTAEEVQAIMESTADKVGGYSYGPGGWHPEMGYGRINARNAVNLTPLVVPSLFAPAGPVSTLRPTFDWSDVPTAEQYNIQISRSSSFEPVDENEFTSGSTFTPSSDLLSDTTYYWRVSAQRGFKISEWSLTWSFTTPTEHTSLVILYGEPNFVAGTEVWSGGPGFSDDPEADSYSMKIPNGWSVKTWRENDPGGDERCWSQSVNNLQDHGWHAAIQSIEVFDYDVCEEGPRVQLYSEPNFAGTEVWSGGPGFSDDPEADSYSMKIPNGWSVKTWRENDPGGDERCWSQSVNNLQDHGWHAAIQSIWVFDQDVCASVEADFVAEPREGIGPLTVQFTDQSRSTNCTINSWSWDFGDGDGSTDQNPTHTYAAVSSETKYTVSLTVGCDGESDTETKTDYITIDPPEVSADFTADPREGFGPLTVHFTDTSTSDGCTIDSWQWAFGDGQFSTLQNPTHTYVCFPQTILYDVTLTVQCDGASDVEYKDSYITVDPPIVDVGFTADMTDGMGPYTVHFTDTTAVEGCTISSWLWDFGDGGTSTEQNPEHVYALVTTEKKYPVSLRVECGCISRKKTEDNYITVRPPVVNADFAADETTGRESLDVTFTDASTSEGCTINSWAWDFGDGETSTEQNPPEHTYGPGIFTVALTARCPEGIEDSEIKANYISVAPPPPEVEVPWPGDSVVTGQWHDTCVGSEMKAWDGDILLGSGTVEASGIYSITISRPAEPGERLQVDGRCHGYYFKVEFDYDVPIPEPATLLLLGSGLAGLAGYARLRSRKRRQ